jgi:hypothetical protein
MKAALITLTASFASLIASAQSTQPTSIQKQAEALTAPATQSGFQNSATMRMLEDLERQEAAAASASSGDRSIGRNDKSTGERPAATQEPARKSEPPKPRNTNFASHAVTTRYLFLKISDSLLRFHVDVNLGDDELEIVTRALGSSCLKSKDEDETCDSSKRNTVLVDGAFFADAKLSQTTRWSRAKTPKGQIWKLVCVSGGDDCFERVAKVRAFKLTTNKSVLDDRILAHGFESQAVRALAKKRRTPASANEPRTLDRVYVTRTTSEKIPLLPKGTL